MGNEASSHKSRQHAVHADDLKKDFPVLTATFVEHATKVVGDAKCLSEENFTKSLFAKIPDFGSVFYQKYQNKETLSVELMTFLNFGSQFSSQELNSSSVSLLKFYSRMFSSDDKTLNGDDISKLLKVCTQSSLAISRLDTLNLEFDKITLSFINAALRKDEPDQKSIPLEDFCHWANQHIPLCARDLHDHAVYRLLKRTNIKKNSSARQQEPLGSSDIYQAALKNESILGVSGLWLVSHFVPLSFIPPSELGTVSNFSRILEGDGWHILYNSNKQGLSANGFTHKALGYMGPTLTFFRFGPYLLLLGLDVEWREGASRRGGYNCFLHQLLPEFKVIQRDVGECVHFNLVNRTIKRGIAVGRDRRNIFQLDSDFSVVTYDMNSYTLSRLEVWGCGGPTHFQKYIGQKEWEKRDTSKHQNRKLRPEDWKDNPDRVLLDYGGIETDHAKRGDL